MNHFRNTNEKTLHTVNYCIQYNDYQGANFIIMLPIKKNYFLFLFFKSFVIILFISHKLFYVLSDSCISNYITHFRS